MTFFERAEIAGGFFAEDGGQDALCALLFMTGVTAMCFLALRVLGRKPADHIHTLRVALLGTCLIAPVVLTIAILLAGPEPEKLSLYGQGVYAVVFAVFYTWPMIMTGLTGAIISLAADPMPRRRALAFCAVLIAVMVLQEWYILTLDKG